MRNQKTPWEREWEIVEKKEQRMIAEKKDRRASFLDRKLGEKIPQTAQERLDTAFSKAFALVFDKGTGLIEKTYKKEELKKDHQVDAFAADVKGDRRSLRAFSRKAGNLGGRNLLLSGAEGIGLGFLGIGLPDIPVFVGMILKSLYEISTYYGYDYQEEKEKYFILLMIRGGLSSGTVWKQTEDAVQEYIRTEVLPEFYDREQEIRSSVSVLSGELLYMKFLQGIPVAGVAGGVYDAVYLKRILDYAKLKYRKRFLLARKNGGDCDEG